MSLRKAWAANFLWCERALGIVVVVALIIWSELLGGSSHLDHFLDEHGETLYIVLAPITAAMLGFILAATAIVVTSAPAERMAVLRESPHYPKLWATFRSALRYLGFATLAALVGLVVSGEVASRIIFYVAAGLSGLAALRTARCIWA
jgi:flagellar motor component MotA